MVCAWTLQAVHREVMALTYNQQEVINSRWEADRKQELTVPHTQETDRKWFIAGRKWVYGCVIRYRK